jgi:hypothetical protein
MSMKEKRYDIPSLVKAVSTLRVFSLAITAAEQRMTKNLSKVVAPRMTPPE